eukprot:TRINITY_DN108_c0_g1_i2.p1 TRINITY_DN108_c0_g1~~TRINITY_DN108_c0_g1_i2.p1  ORF type:complete len:511 (+),score=140.07 TRINITY_DN108_c0_g1_i2:24-1556(+)
MAFDRSKSSLRWAILVLACTGMLGNYYCYDIPTATKKQLCDAFTINGSKLNDFYYNLFYSVYSFPNIVLPLFAGLLVDWLGPTTCLLIFNAFVFVGQGLFAIGLSVNSYYLALVGRAIFGIGGESITVAQSANLAGWFKDKEMAMAMGLDLSISKLGSVINDWVSPAIMKGYSLQYALWFGFIVCCLAILATVILVLLNKYAESKAKQEEELAKEKKEQADREAATKSGQIYEKKEEAPKADENPHLRDIKYFNSRLWLICWSCVIVYATILPFNNISSDFLQDRYEYSTERGDRVMAIPFFVNAVAAPFLGGFVDRLGYRATLLCCSAMSIALVHVLFAFTMITPYVPLVLMGISYAIYAACLWPSVPLVVKERLVGTAFGFITMVQNFGLCFVPMIVGALKTHTGGYEIVELFFACVGSVGVVLSFWLYIEDAYFGQVMNRSHFKKEGEKTLEQQEKEKLLGVHVESSSSSSGSMDDKKPLSSPSSSGSSSSISYTEQRDPVLTTKSD